ncbi:MAG: dihydrofolate reductase family protein [Puniceicoccales bacterium]|jgi:diaminohydroxyphosphoribosylaminopyrimidine deaminase/5-amino-6-(5-phosphoribosylamino)uracil reductase|nr:dihydrofolate reductase family protein [Puniceicoccales bacterium]
MSTTGDDCAATAGAPFEPFMRRAIALARRAWGHTHPNPHVGAVIVENGKIAAEGWHERAGDAHAEINALRALGRPPAADATLVVTLEPCSTRGRTGACTDAIFAAGIRRVVAGATDPFPAHAGRGFALLRAAGVEVINGVLAADCADLNLIFNHRCAAEAATAGEGKCCAAHSWADVAAAAGDAPPVVPPFIALKTAATLDGRIATRRGASQWLTGSAARADVARWRHYFPAIATSAATVLADNPRLTARVAGEPEWCPRRFILDRSGRLPPLLAEARRAGRPTGLRVFDDPFAAAQTTLVTAAGRDAAGTAGAIAAAAGAECCAGHAGAVWTLPRENFLAAFHRRCAREGVAGVYVEGGGRFLGAWLDAGLADYLFYYTAPKILADADALPAFAGTAERALSATGGAAGAAPAFVLRDVRRELFAGDDAAGDDLLTRGFL